MYFSCSKFYDSNVNRFIYFSSLFVDGTEIDGIAQTFIYHIISSSVNFVVNNAN